MTAFQVAWCSFFSALGSTGEWELDNGAGSSSCIALNVQTSSHVTDEFTGIEKAEPKAAYLACLFRVNLIKLIEYFGDFLLGDADSRIADNQSSLVGFNPARDMDRPAFWSEFNGIVEQCANGKINFCGVSMSGAMSLSGARSLVN